MRGTVRLHRVLRSKPERVYRAFLDPEALVKVSSVMTACRQENALRLVAPALAGLSIRLR